MFKMKNTLEEITNKLNTHRRKLVNTETETLSENEKQMTGHQ